jgi:hypothetical protein
VKLTEVVNLVRLLRAIAPAQKFDDYTAEAWQPILDDVRSEDAFAAVKELGKRLPFISPADIRTEVRRMRSERMRHADASFRHHGDPDDVADYMRQLHEHRALIGDGLVPDVPAIDAPVRPPAEVVKLARQLGMPGDGRTAQEVISKAGEEVRAAAMEQLNAGIMTRDQARRKSMES